MVSKEISLDDDISEYPLSQEGLSPSKNFEVWYERWVESKLSLSEHTHRSYRYAINSFISFSNKHSEIPIHKIGARYINRYLMWYQYELAKDKATKEDLLCMEKELASPSVGKNDLKFKVYLEYENTLSQRIVILRTFLKFISWNNIEQHDFTRFFKDIRKIKLHDKITPSLSSLELNMVIKYMKEWLVLYKDHKKKGSLRYAYREALLIVLHATTGARGAEVLQIRLHDIKLVKVDNKYMYKVTILKGKGHRTRSVAVEKGYLKQYIDFFTEEFNGENVYLSSTFKNGVYLDKPMDINTFRVFSNKIFSHLGIEKKGLHSFRRGFATQKVMRENVNAAKVAKMIGNSTATLEKSYIKHEI